MTTLITCIVLASFLPPPSSSPATGEDEGGVTDANQQFHEVRLIPPLPKNVAIKFVVFFISIRQRPVRRIEFDSAQILRLKLRQRRRFVHGDYFFLTFICGEIIYKQP